MDVAAQRAPIPIRALEAHATYVIQLLTACYGDMVGNWSVIEWSGKICVKVGGKQYVCGAGCVTPRTSFHMICLDIEHDLRKDKAEKKLQRLHDAHWRLQKAFPGLHIVKLEDFGVSVNVFFRRPGETVMFASLNGELTDACIENAIQDVEKQSGVKRVA